MVINASDAVRVYLLGTEFTPSKENSALLAILNPPVSSTTRVAMLLLALQPFRFTVTYITDEENVGADKVSRIPSPVARSKAVEINRLAGEIECDTEAEEESDSEIEEYGVETFP